MKKDDIGTAIIATTHRLENGHKFNKKHLEIIALQMRQRIAKDPFFGADHRLDTKPFAKVLDVWVDNFIETESNKIDDEHYAVYMEFEVLDNNELKETKRKIENMGFSISFFSEGIANWKTSEDKKEDLLIGFSPSLNPDFEHILSDASNIFEETNISVRKYHEHAAEPATVILISIGVWLLDKLGGKIVDRIVDLLLNNTIDKNLEKDPEEIKMNIETINGDVNIYLPYSDDTTGLKNAIKESMYEVLEYHNSVNNDVKFIGITYDKNYNKRVNKIRGENIDFKV